MVDEPTTTIQLSAHQIREDQTRLRERILLLESADHLSVTDLQALRTLVQYVDQITEEAAYSSAKRLLASRWRLSIITLAGIVAAITLLGKTILNFFMGLP